MQVARHLICKTRGCFGRARDGGLCLTCKAEKHTTGKAPTRG